MRVDDDDTRGFRDGVSVSDRASDRAHTRVRGLSWKVVSRVWNQGRRVRLSKSWADVSPRAVWYSRLSPNCT